MAPEFLSEEWFAAANRRLADTATPRPPLRVVFEVTDGPANRPHAFTLVLGAEAARLQPGDDFASDLVIALAFRDAAALAEGTLNGSLALREGRLKLRGDVGALVDASEYLVAAQAAQAGSV